MSKPTIIHVRFFFCIDPVLYFHISYIWCIGPFVIPLKKYEGQIVDQTLL